MNVVREFTLDEVLRILTIPVIAAKHIKYDPNVAPQYYIRRGSSHDSIFYFTLALLQEGFRNLLDSTSYFKGLGEPSNDTKIQYTVGLIKLTTSFEEVDLPCGRVQGVREVLEIPVCCNYIGRVLH